MSQVAGSCSRQRRCLSKRRLCRSWGPFCVNQPHDTILGWWGGAGGGQQNGTLTQQASTLPELGPDVSPLSLMVENVRADILRVKIGAQGRWEVPRATFPSPANVSAGGALAHK